MKLKTQIQENIVNTAESLFNAYGYYPVSLEAIAEAAGVSKRTLYKYFGDKNGLVAAVLVKRDQFFKDSLSSVVEVFAEPKDKINAIMAWHIRWFNQDDYHGCMFVRAQAEYGDRNDVIQQAVKTHKQWIEQLIAECLGEKLQHQDAAHLIMVILEGMIAYAMVFRIKNNSFMAEKKYIFQLIETLTKVA